MLCGGMCTFTVQQPWLSVFPVSFLTFPKLLTCALDSVSVKRNSAKDGQSEGAKVQILVSPSDKTSKI
jgi:hypothetical protein